MARSAGAPPLSPRERLLFEAGIKLGGVFHQYLGIPVTAATAPALAAAIQSAIELQPYVDQVRVRIDVRRGAPMARGRYAYRYLTPEMLRVDVRVSEGGHQVEARLDYSTELRYPLMRVLRTRGPRER